MLRVSMAMNGADAPRSRNQTWDFVFGTWYYAKVVIPNKRYVVWFDYISKAPDSFQIQNEIRKIINKVISSRMATF
jgi:hypothetical protein